MPAPNVHAEVLRPASPPVFRPPATLRGEALLLRGSEGGWPRLVSAARRTADALGARGVAWVCFQHPAAKVRARLGGGWPGRVVFVDTVSRPAGVAGDEPDVLYCEGPGAVHTVLGHLHALLKEEGPWVVVWDSLNAALAANSREPLLRAVTSVNARIHDAGSTVLYHLVEGSVDRETSRALEGTVDRVLSGSPTWRQVLSLEKPLLYVVMTAMAAINAGLTMVLLRLLNP